MNLTKKIAFGFIITGLACLITGLLFGFLGSLVYVFPNFLKDTLSFQKLRPLHVFLVTQWIWCAALGCMYYYINSIAKLFSARLALFHLLLQIIVITVAVSAFFAGKFSGREYMEFSFWLVVLLIAGFIMALINLAASLKPHLSRSPVFVWSWTTGLIFFVITLTESVLWKFSFFNANPVRDTTIQWKALGSMVGAWNMLIYGSAIFIMSKTSGRRIAYSKTAFAFYFLGLTNLMFNWGHHTYVVPASGWIKNVAYVISMTELLLLFKMIKDWTGDFRKDHSNKHLSFQMLVLADRWILLNLFLAIVISVPFINQFTHGTHITVAHAMGATIGINTTLLLAAVFFICKQENMSCINYESLKTKLWVFNLSLLTFWLSLLVMGVGRSVSQVEHVSFYNMLQKISTAVRVFSLSGFVLMAVIIVIAFPIMITMIKNLKRIAMQENHPELRPFTDSTTTIEKLKM
ncbi:hypothetical protein BH09BAC2_BH09BAC2_04350 [soil metagenome]